MSLRRSARAGTTITLRARMFDDLGDAVQASGVAVRIYEPDVTDPCVVGIPTYWDEGIFEYDWDIPDEGPGGIYTDIWTAQLNGQTLSGVFEFEVSASGDAYALEGQLHQNNFVNVIVASGICASDGGLLEEEYDFSFLTEVYPQYTDLNKVQLEVGAAIPNLEDDAIYIAILEASLEADQLTFRKVLQNSDFFTHARREWTTCRAAATLATNVRAGMFVLNKKLGDFSVSYNAHALDDLLDRIAACLERWEPQLMAGGYAKQVPSMFVKGELDPDRPFIGRSWVSNKSGDYLSRRMPAANSKTKSTTQRRWKKGFRSGW